LQIIITEESAQIYRDIGHNWVCWCTYLLTNFSVFTICIFLVLFTCLKHLMTGW